MKDISFAAGMLLWALVFELIFRAIRRNVRRERRRREKASADEGQIKQKPGDEPGFSLLVRKAVWKSGVTPHGCWLRPYQSRNPDSDKDRQALTRTRVLGVGATACLLSPSAPIGAVSANISSLAPV